MIEILAMKERVRAVFSNHRIEAAAEFLRANEPNIEADQIAVTMIPAPPFQEDERGRCFAELLRGAGLHPILDAVGNVIAPYDDFGRNPVVLCAHLDTVFPAHVPLELRRSGRVLSLPGIADNGSGLVALLWVLRAAKESGLWFRRPVVAVASVGEEGRGNLRGVRHLFQAPPWDGRKCEFIAIDVGGPERVIHQGLGSLRFRIRMTGPGGHSWADFGRPNPVHTLASLIHRFTSMASMPGVTFNFGVISGGISVNAIPTEASVELDMRSTSAEQLSQLRAQLKRCANEESVRAGVGCQMELIGERPSGGADAQSELVQAAMETARWMGLAPLLDTGSTDANMPMFLGIPAIAVGAGGSSGNIHTPGEWFDPTGRDVGLVRLLALVAVLAGIR